MKSPRSFLELLEWRIAPASAAVFDLATLVGADGFEMNGDGGLGIEGPVPVVTISGDGTKATFIDVDGDKVTVRTTAGQFTATMFDLRAEGSGAQLEKLTLDASFAGAHLSFQAEPADLLGNRQVNVGAIDAAAAVLGKVKVAGDLGQLDASRVKLLSAKTLGVVAGTQEPGTVDPFHSVIAAPTRGNLGKLKIGQTLAGIVNVSGKIGAVAVGLDLGIGGANGAIGLIRADGKIGEVLIGGSVFARSDQTEPSGIRAGGTMGPVEIGFDFGGPLAGGKSAVISALGNLAPGSAAAAVAITSVTIGRDMINAAILAGYDPDLVAANADASIGPVKVGRDWDGSDLVAGAVDGTADGFGRNDTLIAGGDPALLARIASVTIKGAAIGTIFPNTDHFGITAEEIGKAKITRILQPLTEGKDDILISPSTNDFRLVEL